MTIEQKVEVGEEMNRTASSHLSPTTSNHAGDPCPANDPEAPWRSPGPWPCFHCSFTAHTPEEAREHFGPDRWEIAACQALTAHRQRIERIIGDPGVSARVMFLLECLVRNVPDAYPDYSDALVQKVAQAFADLNAGPWQTFAKEAEACIAIVRAHSVRPSSEAMEASAEAALWREHDARGPLSSGSPAGTPSGAPDVATAPGGPNHPPNDPQLPKSEGL